MSHSRIVMIGVICTSDDPNEKSDRLNTAVACSVLAFTVAKGAYL